MRPDRIIVGEVRDASALDMLQAMNTGHDGSICTVHSNGPRDTLARVETMVLMAGMDLPIRAIREQVASAVDLIVHQTRFRDGSRRITHITEVERMEGDVITLQDIFAFDHSAGYDANGKILGTLRPTGLRPKLLDKLQRLQRHRRPAHLRDGAGVTAMAVSLPIVARDGWRAGAVLGCALAALPLAAAAADDPGASIAHVEVAGDQLHVLVSVPAGAEVDLGGVTASVDGTDADGERRAGQPDDHRTAHRRDRDRHQQLDARRSSDRRAPGRPDLPRHGAGRRLRRHRQLRRRPWRRRSLPRWTATPHAAS